MPAVMPLEVEINYVCNRGYVWTEYINEVELDAKLGEARSKHELERAEALSKACVRYMQRLFTASLDAAPDCTAADQCLSHSGLGDAQ